MRELKELLDFNKKWAEGMLAEDPAFFERLASNRSTPEYLWIGCADARIPANEMLGLPQGSVFTHRNIANLVVNTDFNCLSVMQYAVQILKVRHIIVCGHYDCRGVKAAMEKTQLGLADNWLRNIRDVYARNRAELEAIADLNARYDRLIELNVVQQVMNVCHTNIVQNAWARGQKLDVHGWVYRVSDGLLKDLGCLYSQQDQLEEIYRTLPPAS
ncbi:carbonate dehydratase [Candidatus Sumerlaeota bacterium]|nr:carbonate dehydratase [Candidatus Sumerlaeota bacterium]